jgi:large subunit ribosomal protein L17
MLRNQATSLLRYEHLTTTIPRAKEVRPFVERLITIAKRGIEDGPTGIKALNARRLVLKDLQDREVVSKLFDTLAPRFQDRPGGYTRILRIGYRRGDSAEVAQMELVGSEFNPAAQAEADAAKAAAAPKSKGVGGRLKAAADRMRGGGKKDQSAAQKTKASKPAKGGGRKTTTPRKAGGA